jgi:hypothetical protein
MLKNLFGSLYQSNRFTIFNTALLVFNLGLGTYYIMKSPPRIEVVDMTKLISEKAKRMAEKYPTGNVPQPLMQQVVDGIKDHIDEFGKTNGITILAKGAVLSGEFNDCTSSISTALQEEK